MSSRLIQGASMAEHLASIFGTEKDRVNCPFYFKIGACRHGDRCSRLHNRPTISPTLLLSNMYQQLGKFGEIESLNVCDNLADHMIGAVLLRPPYHCGFFSLHVTGGILIGEGAGTGVRSAERGLSCGIEKERKGSEVIFLVLCLGLALAFFFSYWACLGSPEIGLLNMKLVRKRSKLSG
ncbi:unnamed protein product, partial [Vitis vinifera]